MSILVRRSFAAFGGSCAPDAVQPENVVGIIFDGVTVLAVCFFNWRILIWWSLNKMLYVWAQVHSHVNIQWRTCICVHVDAAS